MTQDQVNVRYMVNDVQQSVDWYTSHLGFEQISNAAPAFAGGPVRQCDRAVSAGGQSLTVAGRVA
jgi:catechol 2,3-dioxygenase-like lactoylglutathione lyase family enzyme